MPFRYRFDWEFELLTPETMVSLIIRATMLTCEQVVAEPNLDNINGILNTAADGWQIIVRLFKIQNPKLAHLV